MNELESLKKELARLQSEKGAFQTQSKLLENFIALAGSSEKLEMLPAILQKTLDVAVELTASEKGSLFLLNKNGVVTDSILTRGETTKEQRKNLIGTVLDKGLAGWVGRYRRIGLITDTKKDSRWLDLPNQPYTVRAALAVPILRGEDLLGILTLLHAEPRHFNRGTAKLMQMTAVQIGITLENARLYSKLDKYSKALNDEMEKGKKIQKDFLPEKIPRLPGWEIDTYFHPARQVSGDFYDVFLLPGDRLGFVIADVCDKGVGSALFMALFRSLIRVFSGQTSLRGLSISEQDYPTPEIGDFESGIALNAITLTNDYIAEEHGKEGMFATIFFGILNPVTGKIAYVNAGHEPLFIVGSEGVRKRLPAESPAVGMMPSVKFSANTVRINPGEMLIGYTDGVTEALSPEEKLFTKRRFMATLEKPSTSASNLITQIKSDLFNHIGNAPQADDITMIALHRKA